MYTRKLGPVIHSILLALLTIALLWPPGPYSPRAYAQEQPPSRPRIFLPQVSGGRGTGAPAPTPQPPTPTPQPTPQPSPPTTVPDLRFTPDAVTLAPGDETTITVRVDPAADLRGSSFELPGVQDGVSSSFEAAADGTSGTLTLTASDASEAAERMLEVQGTSGLDSTKTWVGALRITTTATTTAKTIFVDAAKGNDTNDGRSGTPVKTIKQAFTKVVKGDTVKLLPGGYGPGGSGDTYPLLVPNGVTIAGTLASNGAKQTSLSPATGAEQALGLTFAGDARIKDLELDVFGTAIQASKGKLTLSNLNFILNRLSVELTGNARATATKAYILMQNARGASVADHATLTLDGGGVDMVGGCNSSTAIHAFHNGVFHVKNTTFNAFPSDAIRLQQEASGDISSSQFKPVSVACGNSTLITVDQEAHLKLSNVTAPGAPGLSRNFLSVSDSGTLEADQLTVSNYGTVISAGGATDATISNSFLSNNKLGLSGGTAARIDVSKTTFFNNEFGLRVFVLKLRDSSVKGGNIGIFASGTLVDLGNPGTSLGNNIFADSADTSVYFDPGTDGAQLLAVGNTWNASTQGASVQGKYTVSEVEVGDPLSKGQNFRLDQPDDGGFPISIRLNF